MRGPKDRKLLMLRLDNIKFGRFKTREGFDEYELYRLSESISENGIIEPLAVRQTELGYELMAGARRLMAAKMAGLKRVPCVLYRADNTTAAVFSIGENLHRSNLDFFEEAEAINRLISESGITETEAATRLSISHSALCNKLRLLHIAPEQRRRIIAADLSERHARALLRLEGADREKILDRIIAGDLSVAATEHAITELLDPTEPSAEKIQPTRRSAISDPRFFANSIDRLVNTIQNSGHEACYRKSETEKYIEYRIKITKSAPEKYKQLRIC